MLNFAKKKRLEADRPAQPQLPALDAPSSPAPGDPEFAAALAGLDDDERYAIEERAAVAEFDAGMSRPDAERMALADPWAVVRLAFPLAEKVPAVEDFHRRMSVERMARRLAEREAAAREGK